MSNCVLTLGPHWPWPHRWWGHGSSGGWPWRDTPAASDPCWSWSLTPSAPSPACWAVPPLQPSSAPAERESRAPVLHFSCIKAPCGDVFKKSIQTHPLTAWHNAGPGPLMTLASALLWPASSFNPGHQTHSEAGPGAEALHCGGSLHPDWPDCPNTSPPALSMVPSYKPHIELGPMALMGFPPMTCGEQGEWMAALYRGTEGSPPGPARGNHSQPGWSTSWSAFHRSSSVCCLKGSRFFLMVPVKRTGSCG